MNIIILYLLCGLIVYLIKMGIVMLYNHTARKVWFEPIIVIFNSIILPFNVIYLCLICYDFIYDKEQFVRDMKNWID